MKVIIDNIEYAPAKKPLNDGSLDAALDLRFDSDAGDNITIREYFQALLITLWDKQDGFSGKRPFGNSGWTADIAIPLVKAGFITGKVDEDGYLQDYNAEELDEYGRKLIRRIFEETP